MSCLTKWHALPLGVRSSACRAAAVSMDKVLHLLGIEGLHLCKLRKDGLSLSRTGLSSQSGSQERLPLLQSLLQLFRQLVHLFLTALLPDFVDCPTSHAIANSSSNTNKSNGAERDGIQCEVD